jgi:hypothetical protein
LALWLKRSATEEARACFVAVGRATTACNDPVAFSRQQRRAGTSQGVPQGLRRDGIQRFNAARRLIEPSLFGVAREQKQARRRTSREQARRNRCRFRIEEAGQHEFRSNTAEPIVEPLACRERLHDVKNESWRKDLDHEVSQKG